MLPARPELQVAIRSNDTAEMFQVGVIELRISFLTTTDSGRQAKAVSGSRGYGADVVLKDMTVINHSYL